MTHHIRRSLVLFVLLLAALVCVDATQAATPTKSQMRVQFDRAQKNGWVRIFKAVEAKYHLPRGLLLALASRETNLNDVVGDGGHGRGLLQIDDRYHQGFLASHNALAEGRTPPVKAAAAYAAQMLVSNHHHGIVQGVVRKRAWRFAVAAYNAGFTGALNGVRFHSAMDHYTAHGDYSQDVWYKRRPVFVRFLAQAEAPKTSVRQPDIELDARAMVVGHGTMAPIRIILHSTESYDGKGVADLFAIASFWQRQGLGIGAHLTIDADGATARNLDDRELGYHVAGRNTGSLGIEQIGFARFSKEQWLARAAQLEKVAKWLAYWSKLYGIPLRHDPHRGVSTHRDQSRVAGLVGGHWDPGYGYPLDLVLSKARSYRAKGW